MDHCTTSDEGLELAGEAKVLGENQPRRQTINSIRTEPGLNPDFRVSDGTAR
jgi:hypothetical protein